VKHNKSIIDGYNFQNGALVTAKFEDL